ncbi:MjaI family restriction endonuclease [Mucilaginibacter sp. 14171R-50]|uniref:MjaI family restriction endonuclease n=1 Tax=Mucilaginibacter sp. 14171R-50 TaxID=2703789 RepID=UPI00138D90D9|nr:MjaI family restriction endonuclease [Mucilaginibacter sp. 14171R-50]QHS54891.1 MjaI family restriction endonuclease [Mucilaginibacter sp. 14171R-50]
MAKDWISDVDGVNKKFKRETLLNYGMNRWALNKAHSVGSTSELIRSCAPKEFAEWEKFYFNNAIQKKLGGSTITREYITGLGQTLYIKLSEVVQLELNAITEDECIDYAYNLVLNRTFEGYITEIQTVYGQLQGLVGQIIHPAEDKWDRTYSVDFYIEINGRFIGLQIKPIASGQALNQYQWVEMHMVNHQRFEKDFGGKVFFIYSEKTTSGKKIYNVEVVEQIVEEIKRLENL